MGYVQCSKHGSRGLTQTCVHVHAAVTSDTALRARTVADFFQLGELWLCDDCLTTMPKFESEREIEDFYNKIRAVCADCFGEWADKFGAPQHP
jgi:hypothetical protein